MVRTFFLQQNHCLMLYIICPKPIQYSAVIYTHSTSFLSIIQNGKSLNYQRKAFYYTRKALPLNEATKDGSVTHTASFIQGHETYP